MLSGGCGTKWQRPDEQCISSGIGGSVGPKVQTPVSVALSSAFEAVTSALL